MSEEKRFCKVACMNFNEKQKLILRGTSEFGKKRAVLQSQVVSPVCREPYDTMVRTALAANRAKFKNS